MNKDMLKEKNTVNAMIQLFCKNNHNSAHDLCTECGELYRYAMNRLENCPYREDKPSCSKCTTHCYKAEMRERIRHVMRYSGPRMILHHPILAVDHLVKTLK